MEGGLPDHTDRLALELSARFQVSVLTSPGTDTHRSFAVIPTMADWHDGRTLTDTIQRSARGGTVVWQYVPHMYGRGGANLVLPRVMQRLRGGATRQLVLAHELYGPWSMLPHRAWYALAQRLMWRGILRGAEDIGISTDAWIDREIRRGADGRRLFLAPSPSNLTTAQVSADHRTQWLQAHGLAKARRVLGFFGSPGAGKQFAWVLQAWRAARREEPATALIVVGGRVDPPLAGEEEAWCPALGYLESDAASAALQAMDVLALPFVDGVSERRSSFMAGLAHGRAIVSRFDSGTGPRLRQSNAFIGVSGGAAEFSEAVVRLLADPDRCRLLSECARSLYRAEYDWPKLIRRLQERWASPAAEPPVSPA